MNDGKLQTALVLQSRLTLLGAWLESNRDSPSWIAPVDMRGQSLLTSAAQTKMRAIAKADIEDQLSHVKQEFEAL